MVSSSSRGRHGHTHGADLDSTDARSARDGESGSEAGAPPSNTAPDNCNFKFQPLRWGIDSLYLSFPGQLSESKEAVLKRLKAMAQGPEHEASKAQLRLGSHIFEVKDKSSGLFAFTLVDDAYMIRISAKRSKRLPMAYVQVSSRVLNHKVAVQVGDELRALLAELGEVEAPKVSRIDLYVDFSSDLDMESWGREAWVTKASAVNQYAEGKVFTGWTIGAGGVLMGRLYQKLIESQKTNKTYLHDLWRLAGWDGAMPVWRMEFEFKREVLMQVGLDGLPSVLGCLDGLWSYATTEWLRLAMPSGTDQTRSRWPIHPLWMAISSIDWEGDSGPLLRSYDPTRAPSLDWLGSRTLSLLASVGAVSGFDDFDKASDKLIDAASMALGHRYGMSGISLKQGFAEMVEACNRKYNTRLNEPPEDEPEPEDPKFRNEYYRQSRGY
jgi:hypothetical protein